MGSRPGLISRTAGDGDNTMIVICATESVAPTAVGEAQNTALDCNSFFCGHANRERKTKFPL